jgi:NCS1 family nucleobase:cation symporter-1
MVFYALNIAFPSKDAMKQYDEFDIYGTFKSNEARRVGVVPNDDDRMGGEHVIVDGQVRKI